MAKRAEQQRKVELLEELARQRSKIARDRSEVAAQIVAKKGEIKDKINVPKRIKNTVSNSFSGSPAKWFIGSAVGGLILTKLILGKRRPSKAKMVDSGSGSGSGSRSSALSGGLLSTLMLYVAKPMIKKVLINKAKNYVVGRFAGRGNESQIAEQGDDGQYYR